MKKIFTRENALLVLLAAAAGALWTAQIAPQAKIFSSGPRLTAEFLDVGQGDSCLVTTPAGRRLLIDGGPSFGDYQDAEGATRFDFDAGKEIILPYLREKKISRLDFVFVSHEHLDHYGGLISVVRSTEISIGMVVDSGFTVGAPDYALFLQALRERAIPYQSIFPSTSPVRLDVGDPAAELVIYGPRRRYQNTGSDVNNNSLAMRLGFGKTAILFMGDAERESELDLLVWRDRLSANVLKVGHHGSRTSSVGPFLDAVRPEFAIISLGRGNPFGHPHEEVMDRLEQRGIAVYRTDQQGRITAELDGARAFVRAQF